MGFEIGKTVAGYEVVEVMGGLQMGLAYKVRNVFAQRFEILKILPKSVQDDEEQLARFLREIKVHARLVHPNIVTFYNAREIEGQLVMTTEFVQGITVTARLEQGPIPWAEAITYARQALSALQYAHAVGVVHRGLTPGNLIITPGGVVRLGGFGLAKAMSDPQLTAIGSVIGSLHYMAPEQVRGNGGLDARCDIYSLGIVLYEMLVGRVPFDSKSQFEVMLAHVSTIPKRPSEVNPAVPQELDAIVLTALTKEPVDRFQTAQEFSEALEHARLKLQGGASVATEQVSDQRHSSVNSALISAAGSESYSEVAASVAVADENTITPGLELVTKSNGVAPEHHTNGSAAAVEYNSAAAVEHNNEAPLVISTNGVTPTPANRGPAAEVQIAESQPFKPFTSWGTSQFLAACVVMFLIGSVAFFALLALMRP
jgi:serine/threonine protein kinase